MKTLAYPLGFARRAGRDFDGWQDLVYVDTPVWGAPVLFGLQTPVQRQFARKTARQSSQWSRSKIMPLFLRLYILSLYGN